MAKTKGSRGPISDQARAAIERADKLGLTRYRLAKLSGVSASVLSRFAQGGTLSSATLDRLHPHLGLRLAWDETVMLKAALARAKKGGR